MRVRVFYLSLELNVQSISCVIKLQLTNVGCHDEKSVLEIDSAALAVCQATILKDLCVA